MADASGMVTDDWETFRPDNVESEVDEARGEATQCMEILYLNDSEQKRCFRQWLAKA